MNKNLILNWLLQDTEKQADRYYDYGSIKKFKLEDSLHELNNRREITLPPSLPKTPGKMIPVLRKHFKNNVTLISLVLNHYFPKQYFFYRVSKLEKEIFEGFEFFSEIIPEFRFRFSGVGGKGFGRYLELNETLLKFAYTVWPKLKKPQIRLAYFLYQGFGSLFLEKNDYNRYWVMATQEQYFDELDTRDKEVLWSGRKEIQPGDLVFVYRTAPRKAITDILRVKDEPFFDPWGAWDGFWVNLEKVCAIEDISFAEMKQDSVINQWSTVRKNFQGTVTEPIPHIVYNELLKKIDEAIRIKFNLEPEPISAPKATSTDQRPTMATSKLSGQFTSEAEFEEKVIGPLLRRRWGFKCETQYPRRFRVGSQNHHCLVDFYVSDEKGPLTLFEDKLRILNDKDLKPAVDQAKSYALLLGLPSFVVASPEGMWLYSLEKDKEKLVEQVSVGEPRDQEEEFRSQLLKLRN